MKLLKETQNLKLDLIDPCGTPRVNIITFLKFYFITKPEHLVFPSPISGERVSHCNSFQNNKLTK